MCDGYGVHKIEYIDGKCSVFLVTPCGDYSVEEKSVGQYTGMKDKNGIKIYEGDIVRYYRDELAEIKYKNGAFIIESLSSREPMYEMA